MRKRLLITIIFAVVIGLSISGCDCPEQIEQIWPPDTIWVAEVTGVPDTISAEVTGVPDTISAEGSSTGPPDATSSVMAITGWPPDTIMVSFKNVSNDLLALEYIRISVVPDTISWSSDSVTTSTNSFKKYYLNGTFGAKK